jgi:hypothetical protein
MTAWLNWGSALLVFAGIAGVLWALYKERSL